MLVILCTTFFFPLFRVSGSDDDDSKGVSGKANGAKSKNNAGKGKKKAKLT